MATNPDPAAALAREVAEAVCGIWTLQGKLTETQVVHALLPHLRPLLAERDRLRSRRGRCDKHRDDPGPSLYFDCCQAERLRELCRELTAERDRLEREVAELRAIGEARSFDLSEAARMSETLHAERNAALRDLNEARADLSSLRAERDRYRAALEDLGDRKAWQEALQGTYLGGYAMPEDLRIFRHGMGTAVSAMTEAANTALAPGAEEGGSDG